MSTFTGKIKENKISLENVNLMEYEGKDVMVIIYNDKKSLNNGIDLDKYVMPTTDRAKNVDLYMSEMRDGDRV